MQELDLFTLEWSGMIQFGQTLPNRILINTDRRQVQGTTVITAKTDGTIILRVRKSDVFKDGAS